MSVSRQPEIYSEYQNSQDCIARSTFKNNRDKKTKQQQKKSKKDKEGGGDIIIALFQIMLSGSTVQHTREDWTWTAKWHCPP